MSTRKDRMGKAVGGTKDGWKVIEPPGRGTRSAERFFMAWARLNFTANHYVMLSVREDQRLEAERIASDDPRRWIEVRQSNIDKLAKQAQILFELFACRHVDNFQTYLADLLFEALLRKTDILKSTKDTMDVRSIIEHGSFEEIVRAIAERKIASLSYGPYGEMAKFFESHLGVSIGDSDDQALISGAIALRNISVHNACRINHVYIKSVGGDPSTLNTVRRVDARDSAGFALLFGEIVAEVDSSAGVKFGIPTPDFVIDPLA